MPTIEVDEAEFVQLRKVQNAVQRMYTNPEAAVHLERAAKSVDPESKTPRLDELEARQKPVKDLEEKLEKVLKEQADKEAKREEKERLASLNSKWESGRQKLRDRGVTAEGVAEIEKLMESKGIVDHSDGLTLFERDHPPPPPAQPAGFGSWDFFTVQEKGDDDLKKLLETRGQDESVVRKMVNSALAEVRGQPPR